MPTPPPYMIEKPTTFVIGDLGRLVDPFSIEVAVYDVSTDAKRASPVQVFPILPATRYALVSGDKLGTGYYSAPYVPDVAEAKGRRLVRWWVTLESGGDELTWTTEWEVLGAKLPRNAPAYALVSDLRDEGFTTAQLPDVRAQVSILAASRMIERFTGRVFAPVPKVVNADGKGGAALLLDEPIVAINSVTIDDDYYTGTGSSTVSELLRVYNRHVRDGLTLPDDRENPRIEFFHADGFGRNVSYGARMVFPRGQQNVHVDGVFGYTERDGSPMGCTPELVRRATVLLVRRLYGKVGDPNAGGEALAWRVTGEKTRDQSIQYADPAATAKSGTALFGAFTGDPEVDTLIAMFVRPPMIGAA
jgi:hypothetical protein